jgi:hypothetical protein
MAHRWSLRRLAAATALVVSPAVAGAQASPGDSVAPRAGRWGAEAGLGPGGLNASLLRFASPRTALLLGGDFSVGQRESESPRLSVPGGLQTDEETTTEYSVGARIGARRYAAGAGRLRPFGGGGALGTFQRVGFGGSTQRATSAGVYGELGAVWFFNPNVSLGAAGELRAVRQTTRSTTFVSGAQAVTQRSTFTGVSANVARLIGTVYF